MDKDMLTACWWVIRTLSLNHFNSPFSLYSKRPLPCIEQESCHGGRYWIRTSVPVTAHSLAARPICPISGNLPLILSIIHPVYISNGIDDLTVRTKLQIIARMVQELLTLGTENKLLPGLYSDCHTLSFQFQWTRASLSDSPYPPNRDAFSTTAIAPATPQGSLHLVAARHSPWLPR